MNSSAAKELLDVIMLDEFVARRKALDAWSRRWIATMHVEFVHDGETPKGELPELYREAKKLLLTEIFDGLARDEVHVLHWGRLISNKNSLACEVHFVMQEPRDVNAGADATQRMLEMAKGEQK